MSQRECDDLDISISKYWSSHYAKEGKQEQRT